MARVRYARTSDSIAIAYAVEGTGPPLLVARALLRAAVEDELEYQFDAGLPRLAESRSVVIWDHRGFGLSSDAAPEYTLDTSVRDMAAVADALDVAQFDVLAQLTPAHTVLAFAARHPERIRKIVLRNPSAPGGSPRSTALAGLPDIARTHFKEYVQLVALRVMGWERAEAAYRWQRNLVRHFDGETWSALMDAMEAVDAMGEVASVQAPALVISDTGAPDVPADRQQFTRRLAAMLPHGELTVLRGGQSDYARVALEFLDRDGRGDAEAPSGTAVILFVDIAESTALTERIGDAAFRERARTLDGVLRGIVQEHGGTMIDAKTLGDGVLATFVSATRAIDAALACATAGTAQELGLHIGLHAGDVIREEHNVFGGAVNIAARVSALSGGEVLVSDVVRALARTSAQVTFEDRGEHVLKGVGEPQRVFAVRARAG